MCIYKVYLHIITFTYIYIYFLKMLNLMNFKKIFFRSFIEKSRLIIKIINYYTY